MTPTQRTLKWLREQGYTAAVVERWNAHAGVRQDLFGFADLIAFNEHETVLVQATSGSNTSSRVAKVVKNTHARRWMDAGNKILVIGWRQLVAYRKDGTRAKRKRWEPKIVNVFELCYSNGC